MQSCQHPAHPKAVLEIHQFLSPTYFFGATDILCFDPGFRTMS